MKIIKADAFHFDTLEGGHIVKGVKTLGSVRGLYENSQGLPDETPVYTVYSHEDCDPKLRGELYWGLTVLEPLLVNGECNMTRGHFHQDRDCAEYYFGIEGRGLLLLMDEAGETWAEQVEKGSLHHIPGRLAHRLVNVGDVPLKVGACWPATAGHDYGSVERLEFGYRIFKQDGQVVAKERI